MNFEFSGFEDLVANASALERNWSKENSDSEALAGMGADATISSMDSAINDMNKNFDSFYNNIKARDVAAARKNLEAAQSSYDKAKQKAETYAILKKYITASQSIDVADKIFDPDEGAENIAEMTKLGNVSGAAVKGVYKGLFGLIGLGGSEVLSEATEGKFDVVGTIDKGIDTVGGAINKIPGVEALADGVEATLGAGVQKTMNLRLGADQKRYKDARGQLHETKEGAVAFNQSVGHEYEPEEIVYDTRVGAMATNVTGGLKQAKSQFSMLNPLSGIKGTTDEERENFSIWNPFTYQILGNLRKSNREYKESLASQEEAKQNAIADGFTTNDITKWTDADWELDMAMNAEFQGSYEKADREIEAKKKAVNHLLDYGAKPLRFKSYSAGSEKTDTGALKQYPFNTNWYGGDDMGNDWGDIDPIKEGFLDDGGRPTQKLINYANATGRKIELYNGADWGNKDTSAGVDPLVELNPNKEEFWNDASEVMRGVVAPKATEVQEGEMDYLDELYYFEQGEGDDKKLMKYDFDDSEFIRGDGGNIQYVGEYAMDEDHAHLGSDWYEDDFFGTEYRPQEGDRAKGSWRYQTDTHGWVYEATNEAGAEWMYTEDNGWMFPYISEETGEKWVWSNTQQDWGHWDTNKGRDKSDWLWQNPPEPEQTETYNQVDSIADNARDDTMDLITDRTQQMVDDKLSGVQDRVDGRVDQLQDKVQDKVQNKVQQGEAKFGDLIEVAQQKVEQKVEVAQQKVEQKVEKVKQRQPKCRTINKRGMSFEICA